MSTVTMSTSQATGTEVDLGYEQFQIGQFRFQRDAYFAHILYPGGRHILRIDDFLRALMRDVAWGFFYGTVNFDNVFGTVNHYGRVDVFIGLFNDAYRSSNRHYVETFTTAELAKVFEGMLENWTNEGYDPFAAPDETGVPYGPKRGNNSAAIQRSRLVAKRMVGLPGDLGYRTNPPNRAFPDIDRSKPEVHAEPGFEGEVHAFNLFDYLSRSDVTWNPSVASCVKDSQLCPTTEEQALPIIHGNDRVEWFIQASDEIIWDIDDRATGKPRAKVIMKAGDVAAMPADIRHRGYSPKRSMLIVWENNDSTLPQRYSSGQLKPFPVDF